MASEVGAQDFPLFATDYRGVGAYSLDAMGTLTARGFVPGPLNSVREDKDGNLYTCSEDSPQVSKIDPAGNVSGYATGFDGCFGLLFARDGTLYVSNLNAGRIEAVPPGGGSFTTLASGLNGPTHMAFDTDGSILVSEFYGGQLSRVDGSGNVSPVAPGLSNPIGVAVGPDNNIYVSEVFTGQLMRIDRAGNTSLLAARGGAAPTGLDFHRDGRLFVAELFAGQITTVDIGTGAVTVFRGGLSAPVGLSFHQEPVTGQDPTANAGPDQTVPEGAAVSLDGSASSGASLFSWAQIGGPPVALSSANTTAASFTAPLLPGGSGSQTLTFQLTVSDGIRVSSDTVDITVTNVNHPPVADAGVDQTVTEGSSVALAGGASFDPDNDPITYHWVQTVGPSVALTGAGTATPSFTAPLLSGGAGGQVTLTFELTVSDGVLAHMDAVSVTVEQVNHPPTADPGLPQTVHSGTSVSLNGSGSQDPDGDPVTFSWTQVGGTAVTLANSGTAMPSFTAPPVSGSDTLIFRLHVSDGSLAAEADVAITVTNGVPRCDLALPSPALLWPPNHGMRQISINNVTDPNNDKVNITVTGVSQDEPVNGPGDGDTSPDAVVQGATVLLRAERDGAGNGRVYQVTFIADDALGGLCTGSVKVGVPKSMKPGQEPVDDGQLYDSTQP